MCISARPQTPGNAHRLVAVVVSLLLMLYTLVMSRFSFLNNDLTYNAQQVASQPAARRTASFAGSAAGFTIVELLIVIIVIVILAAIVIVAYNGITIRANDAQRVSDVDTVRKFLDMYYVKHGHYMRSDNFLNANAAAALASGPLKGLPPEALRGPSATSSTVSSWGQWGGDVTTNGMDYSVKSFLADGTTNCTGSTYDDSDCMRYTIYYKTQVNDSYKTIVK